MRCFLLMLVVLAFFPNCAKSAGLPTVIGDLRIAGEYEPLLNIVETTGDRSGFLTQESRFRNKATGAELSLKIEYLNNSLAGSYLFYPQGELIENVTNADWQYWIYTPAGQLAQQPGIEGAIHAAGRGKIGFWLESSDPSITTDELVQLVKNLSIDSDRALEFIKRAKPYGKSVSNSKAGLSTMIGTIPVAKKSLLEHSYVKQAVFPGKFETSNGQKISMFSGPMFSIGFLQDKTVIETFCGIAMPGKFDMDDFFKNYQSVLFDGKFTAFSKKEFAVQGFQGSLESGSASLDRTTIDLVSAYPAKKIAQAILIKLRKDDQVHFIRVIAPSGSDAVKDSLVDAIGKMQLECKPVNF